MVGESENIINAALVCGLSMLCAGKRVGAGMTGWV